MASLTANPLSKVVSYYGSRVIIVVKQVVPPAQTKPVCSESVREFQVRSLNPNHCVSTMNHEMHSAFAEFTINRTIMTSTRVSLSNSIAGIDAELACNARLWLQCPQPKKALTCNNAVRCKARRPHRGFIHDILYPNSCYNLLGKYLPQCSDASCPVGDQTASLSGSGVRITQPVDTSIVQKADF